MKFILPRVIFGNRGDLASRWGVLQALSILGERDVTVFCRSLEDVPVLPYRYLNYGSFRNIFQTIEGRGAFQHADTVLWTVGLDMQDDSSLSKLVYLWFMFNMYRRRGLKICVLFQGAGPVTTKIGRWIAGKVLDHVDLFAARDPGTYNLIRQLSPNLKNLILAHDAIFLPGFDGGIQNISEAERNWLSTLFVPDGRPVIGFNIRQWFHFSSSIIPYQFAPGSYRNRSEAKMKQLTSSALELIRLLRSRLDARVLLISAYQPGVVPWEDDSPWLEKIKLAFHEDVNVTPTDIPMSLPAYYALMSRLSLMIGMRLHSSLIALRHGVPAINISYTLKGGDIMRQLGLAENVMDLNSFIHNPEWVCERASGILQDLENEKQKTETAVFQALDINMAVLRSFLGR